jgi:nucleotide-binding universal stress UspA family protein
MGSMRVQPGELNGRCAPRLRCAKILVAVGLDEASISVFQQALRLSQAFRARLQVIHVLARSVGTLSDDRGLASEILLAWAARAGAVLGRDDIVVKVGGVIGEVVEAADEVDADLLVLGRPSARGGVEELLHRLAISGRPALLTGERGGLRSGIVAATDLRAPGAPVVNAAAEVARALRVGVTLIHNFEQVDEPRLPSIVSRLHHLERLARELAPVRAARVTTENRTEAISGIARATNADLVAVGLRCGGGRTVCSLLEGTSTALLVVPIPSPRLRGLPS